MALVLSLSVLLGVTTTALAFLTLATLEPQISRNLADVAQARGLADAGLEIAYARLGGDDPGISDILAGAEAGSPWVSLTWSGQPGGAYSVRLRNDLDSADRAVTGVLSGPEAGETAQRDGNGLLIVQSTGVARRSQVTIEAVFRRSADGVALVNRRELP